MGKDLIDVEYVIPEGSFQYGKLGRDGIELVQYQGLAGHVEIPEKLPCEEIAKGMEPENAGEEKGDATGNSQKFFPVRALAKKVFLSKKYLRSVVVPASVESVGDWAFAYCDSLREVTFLGRNVQFGKDVFKECAGLRCVRFQGEAIVPNKEGGFFRGSCKETGVSSNACDGVGALMAAAVTQMDASYLLDAKEAGSPEWLGKWDARMLTILHATDDEGYAKQILCGEEDYESADLETYLRNSRKRKVRLLLLRLLWPMELAPAAEKECREYLLSHTMGCATEETWAVIRDEYGNRREFYELFAMLGCLTKENAPEIIAETRQDCPEMKAYFLRYQAEHFGTTGFFDDMEL